jgi:acetate kinase
MKVLVLNSGSSSVKFQLFNFEGGDGKVVAKGIAQRVGQDGATLSCKCPNLKGDPCTFENIEESIPNHSAAINQVCQHLLDPVCGAISDLSEVSGIGHRVVHGGERFTGSVLIDDDVIEGIEDCAKLAPLHNPPALLGIRAGAEIFEGTPQVAVFDTAFHHTIPEAAFTYALPHRLYTEFKVRKYGFHGTSHQFVAEEAARELGRPLEELRIITCHLGNGCSITAVKNGESIDTSMGLTPLGGVMMGTRPGDIDPYVPIYMHRELGMPINEVDETLNKESGLKGICGLTDMRDVEAGAESGDAACALALEMFTYRIARYIGSYAMVLGGVDAIVFTAGIGENVPSLRAKVLERAGFLGVAIDPVKNAANARNISAAGATVATLVIPTNEELVIARETLRLVQEYSARGVTT